MAVNYISEIRIFYDRQMAQPLSAGQISLWHALMEMNNRALWREWFPVKMCTLETMSGLTRGGVRKAMDVLIRLGFVQKDDAGMYKICRQKSHSESHSESHSGSHSESQKKGSIHINIIKEKKRNETKDEEVICDDGLQDLGGEVGVQFAGGIKL